MNYYCTRCTALHSLDELCVYYRNKLRGDPTLLSEAAKFASIAGQYELVSGQGLDHVAKSINQLSGMNLSYEGAHQYVRDVQVFRQLNVDAYCKSGIFSSAENARAYMASGTDGQLATLTKKLNGTAQEIDWVQMRNGKLSALWQRSTLLGEEVTNAAGVDGVTINRFTGTQISRTTVKATQDISKGLGTNVKDVVQALENGTLDPIDNVAGVRGTASAVRKAIEGNLAKAERDGNEKLAMWKQARDKLTVEEVGTDTKVRSSTARLKDKITNSSATPALTGEEIARKAVNGAVIGAVIGLSVSTIVNYLEYKEGNISKEQAFQNVSQATVKGALTGGALNVAALFLPAGALGFVAGMAVGIYLNAALTNILDEIYGKGTYVAILDASGFILGASMSLQDALSQLKRDQIVIEQTVRAIRSSQASTTQSFDIFKDLMGKQP
ncbi:hypothetical protein LOY55_09785 [Pseudomonas sp. B21-040]|uniref:hypothetical protein n=1 Tax=Pseudomonas sp. B21-040 TaxID=2895486 RepID=UPI00215DECC3|nr:hypothetical protein [Pseudomonas sp. B21-040]UVL42370.1 hypothetical protein LOY55_09785 [Pseudomonas sp. B21-040]